MATTAIYSISSHDLRFELEAGAGADSVHSDPQYSYAVTRLHGEGGISGTGLAFTLGGGNELVCAAIDALSAPLLGQDIEALMADFRVTYRAMLDHPQYRWLGPHKGVVHLALSSIVNACFDLWAKARGLPLWRLLLELSPEQLLNSIDLAYLEDALSRDQALALLQEELPRRPARMSVIKRGYPGYDTSIGWFQYSDAVVRDNIKRSIDRGFDALKLKVGSSDSQRDIRRAHLAREAAGDEARLMLDVNQQWRLPQAIDMCQRLRDMNPYWIEEPTHPDDILAHQRLSREIAPLKLAIGEHLPNQVMFKNYLQAGAAGFLQPDCARLGGVAEFIAVSLLSRKFDIPVVPHVGDMGQIHQHLVLFNHIALGHEIIFLEYIPHLRERFTQPARVEGGVYITPQEPGSSSDLLALESA